jgi:hypothetical protein
MASLRLVMAWEGSGAPVAYTHVHILSFHRSLIKFCVAMARVCGFGLLRGSMFSILCLRVAVCRYAAFLRARAFANLLRAL